MEKVYTEKAPAAIGPYSQAMKAGGLLFTSGQIPIDPATGAVAGEDITAQTEQVMQNLGAVLEAAGAAVTGGRLHRPRRAHSRHSLQARHPGGYGR